PPHLPTSPTRRSSDLRELAHIHPREPLRRRLALARIHAHVERRVPSKREASLRPVELKRRHAQIEEKAVERSRRIASRKANAIRSDEHTSELQSRENL